MKRLLKYSLALALGCAMTLGSCNKEGEGGTSAITGQIVGIDHDDERAEVTEITFTNGNTVEHGDYFLLNTPSLAAYYYVWFDNPTWITNGDPGLTGRIGIPVVFNYSDSNTEIANNTASAILAETSAYTIETLNDILILTCTLSGNSPDADNVTSPFNMEILTQGKDATTGSPQSLIDEKVYIIYGDNALNDDLTRTAAEGKFQFTGLTPGKYTLYASSKDTLTGLNTTVEHSTEIVSKNSTKDVGIITVYF